jgi:uncharacterized protein (TIGR00369 family)
MSPEQLLARGRLGIGSQPFSRLLDARVDAFTVGHAEISIPMQVQILQQHGFVHGGVISYLADNALTLAGASRLGDSVTAEYKINYLRPAKEADRLAAVATVVGAGKTQAVVRCDVFLVRSAQGMEERVLCAAAQGTISKLGA